MGAAHTDNQTGFGRDPQGHIIVYGVRALSCLVKKKWSSCVFILGFSGNGAGQTDVGSQQERLLNQWSCSWGKRSSADMAERGIWIDLTSVPRIA